MFKSVSVPNPNPDARRFNGRKRGSGNVRHFRTTPPIEEVGPHYYGDNDGQKELPIGNRQRWVKARDKQRKQGRFIKAQIRVGVSF